METAHHPAESDGPFGGRPPQEAAGPSSPLRDRVMAAYLPVAALLERLEETGSAVGSSAATAAPRLEAVRALLEEQGVGDWTDLARLLVDPAELTRRTGPTGTIATPAVPDDPRALFYEDYRNAAPAPAETGPEVTEPVPSSPEEIVQAALDSPHACLVRAADGPERTAALAEIVRRLAADGRRTLLLAPDPQAVAALLDALREMPEIKTLRAEPPGDGAVPDPLDDLKRLRRELLWLEQWPRDLTALEDLRAHGVRRRAELAAEEQRLVAAIEAVDRRIETADEQAAEARERLERAERDRARRTEEADRARATWREVQDIADASARDADARTRAADTAEARHRDLAQQTLHCEQELQAARDREATLTDELTRARETLPVATRETEQLSAAAADATAAQHASYYRLAAAESGYAAQRRKLTWGQRLHVAAPPPEVEEARQLVKSRRREAEDAAERAHVAVQAHQQAEALRAGLARFMADAEHELVTLTQTQERLGGRLATLTAERDTAYAEAQRLAREAAEAVGHADRSATTARQAGQAATEAEQHAAAARHVHDEATAGRERADAEAAEARNHRSALDAELERHRADTTTQIANLEAELRAFDEAEARSRRHVQRICGTDLDEVPMDLLSRHRAEAMARIEELAADLESADLVHGTPPSFGRSHYSRGTVFDTLIVVDADRLGDADLLIGAVRTRHWLLVADGQGRPPHLAEDHPEYAHLQDLDPTLVETATDRLQHSTFGRCLATAPALCHDLTLPTQDTPTPANDTASPPPPADATTAEPTPPAQPPTDTTRPLTPMDDVPSAPPSLRPEDTTRPLTVLPDTPEAPTGEPDPTVQPTPEPNDPTQTLDALPADTPAKDQAPAHPLPANEQPPPEPTDATRALPVPPTDTPGDSPATGDQPPADERTEPETHDTVHP
ncbi:Part of AAA domain-containing protein, partial [Thermomonospora echinospora]